MSKGVLFDVTKCVGCGSCTVACKMWNNHEYENGQNAHGFDAKLDGATWTAVTYHNVKTKSGEEVLRYVKEQCMHCLDPICASVCFAKALLVTEDGAVHYNADQCVGCRYCMIACPFEIPKYEWSKVLPSVSKCQFCSSKIATGESPACTSVCPTGALLFGEREELLQIAHDRINNNSMYVDHVYGEKEAGGTSWLSISDVPFADLGYKDDVPERALPHFTHDFTKLAPAIYLGGGALFAGLSYYTHRRHKVAEAKHEK